MNEKSPSAEPVATVVNGHTFTIDTRYVLRDSRILGKGSFGVVCTAYDSIRKIDIAIKRIRPYANDEWDAKHTLREIRLLKLLGPHPNVVSLFELSLFQPKTELYMMMELMDCDLHRVIQSKQPLSEKHHKCFVKQILEAIKAMHAIGVFHRDLKPGNILVSKDCQVRITDFGLARFMDEPTRTGQNDVSPMTEYVVTRWYRCPELLLSPNRPYSEAIDLWSIGCILAELLRRKPLFPGKNHANQVQLIFEVLGYNGDGENELGFPISGEAAAFLDKRCRFRRQPLKKFIPDASDAALALVESLLTVNPATRPSATTALAHPFLLDAEILNDYSKNYLSRPTVDYFNFEHEKFTVAELKEMIDQEVYASAANAYRFRNTAASSNNNNNNAVLNGGSPPLKGFPFGANNKSNTTTPTTALESNSSGITNPAYYQQQQPAAAIASANPPHQLSSQYSQQHLVGSSTAGNNENEGPASQLATQMKNTRLDKAMKDNPFSRNNNNNPVSSNVVPKGGGILSNNGIYRENSADYQEDTKQQLQKFLKTDSTDSNRVVSSSSSSSGVAGAPVNGPSGSILTAVRNDMGPPGTRGRKSVPKTPSPQKMDLILQKDYQNKQRMLNNNNNDYQNSARSTDSNQTVNRMVGNLGGNYSNVSGNRKSLPNTTSGGGGIGYGESGNSTTNPETNQTATTATKKVNKVMGMPFPSLTGRMTKAFGGGGGGGSSNTSSSAAASNTSSSGIPSSALVSDSYVQYSNYNINRSAAMVQSGSNVIHNAPSSNH